MNEEEIVQNFVNVYNKNASDAEKFSTLKFQYGIASRKIHELKGSNALLRETNAQLLDELDSLQERLREYEAQPQPLQVNRVPRVFSKPEHEAAAVDLILMSKGHLFSTDETFRIKYCANPFIPQLGEKWWSLADNDKLDSWADWDYWQRGYGPFTEVLNVDD